MTDATIRAIDAIMDFSDAMCESVSIRDLREGFLAAIESGFDMLEIQLTMATMAVQEAGKIKEGGA
jgi:hypothetical protein